MYLFHDKYRMVHHHNAEPKYSFKTASLFKINKTYDFLPTLLKRKQARPTEYNMTYTYLKNSTNASNISS